MFLAIGWLAIIASLFWDPLTPELTRPENVASPFHLQGKHVEVQGKELPEEPYAMGNRIWWTMLIPILPLFFLVAGHEAWRRICPLSFLSQIPRYLGWQRKRRSLDRRSGKVSRLLALPARDGWMRRNVWYVQFGLLFAGLTARLLFVNSDRVSLAFFFIFIIVSAMVVGALWGGKAWCNYVCPVAVVQKIYTQPRGLLESTAHTAHIPITQSMCRAPGEQGDKSTCVGCTPSCPDIDLEKSHWDSLLDPARRNVYYMFLGLVIGFYCFYYVYAGTWDYYFSGAWTHERSQLATLFDPGIYLFGAAWPIPKLIAAPLVLAFFVASSWAVCVVLEKGYRKLRAQLGNPLAEQELMNHCLVFCAYVTINTFYLFGGRPNLGLLPVPALRAVDIAIVALTTLWFWQGIQRTPLRYRRESLATSLREQLRGLKVDLVRFLEGRKLEELKPDEVYVLAKTLPQFSHDQKLSAYRNILEDALQQGRTNSAASLEMLREVRHELGVNDDEHRSLLADLGAGGGDSLDPDEAATYENWIRIGNYRRALEMALIGPMESGHPLATVLQRPEVKKTIEESQELYRITMEEHETALSQVTGHDGMLFERARELLEPIARLASLRMGLAGLMPRDEDCAAIARLISKVLRQRLTALCAREFSVMLTLGDSPESLWLARNLANVLGRDLETALDEPVAPGSRVTWEESLGADVVIALRGASACEPSALAAGMPPPLSFRKVLDDALDVRSNLARLAEDADPRLQALALTALAAIDLGRARDVASRVAQSRGEAHWLLEETLASVLGEGGPRSSDARRYGAITLTVASPNAPTRPYSLDKPYITVGRDRGNDVVIAHPSAAPFHLTLSHGANGVEVRRADPMVRPTVDGVVLGAEPVVIGSGARVALREDAGGPTFVVSWNVREERGFTLQSHDTLSRMVWLSQVAVFERLDLESLADIAETAEVRLYDRGTWLCREGEPSTDAFMLQSGALEVIGGGTRIGELGPRSIVGEIGVLTQRPRAASLRVTTAVARVVTLDGERLRRLIASNAAVAAGMLVGVAHYVGGARPSSRNTVETEAA